MDEQTLARFRSRLHRRRREIIGNREAAEVGVRQVREGRTAPEYEEGVQTDQVEYTLQKLSDANRRELIQVDSALARIDAGTYGECIECGTEIAVDRLEAIPYALRCTECALRDEERSGMPRGARAPTL